MLGILSYLACVLGFDEIAFVQADSSVKKAPYFVLQYSAAQSGTIVANAKHSYGKFFEGGGKNPVRWMAAADVDGDGRDEYVVVREKKGSGAATINVFPQPAAMGSKQPKPMASYAKAGLPPSTGDGALAEIGSIAFDADPADELLFLRNYADGRQELEIVDAPAAKKQALAAPLATIVVAEPGADRVRTAFGVGTDSVNEVLVLVHEAANGELRLASYPKPNPGASTLDAPLASAPIAVAAGETWIDAAEGARTAVDEAWILVATRTVTGATRVDRVHLAGTFGALAATQTFSAANTSVRHVFGVEQPGDPAPPPPEITTIDILVGQQIGGSTIAFVNAGTGSCIHQPTGGFKIVLPSNQTVQLNPTAVPSQFTPVPALITWAFDHPVTGVATLAQLDLTDSVLTQYGTLFEPRFAYSVSPGDDPIGSMQAVGFPPPTPLLGVSFGGF